LQAKRSGAEFPQDEKRNAHKTAQTPIRQTALTPGKTPKKAKTKPKKHNASPGALSESTKDAKRTQNHKQKPRCFFLEVQIH